MTLPPAHAPSRRPVVARRTLALVAAMFGIIAPLAGRWQTPTTDPAPIAPLDLASWIRDRQPGLRVIDLRSRDAFEQGHVASAESLDADARTFAYAIESSSDFDGGSESHSASESAARPSTSGETRARKEIIVVYDGGTAAIRRVALPFSIGETRRVFYLRGGFVAWESEVMFPVLRDDATPAERADFARASELSRYFGGTPQKRGARSGPLPSRPRGC